MPKVTTYMRTRIKLLHKQGLHRGTSHVLSFANVVQMRLNLFRIAGFKFRVSIIELCGLNRLWEGTAQQLWKKLRFVENRFLIMMRIEV